MFEGKRVLALAERTIPAEIGMEQLRSWSRADVEQNLKFVAFLLFDSELKPESREVIQDLHDSSHTTIMITGDSVLTAIEVARRLNMVSSDISTTLVLNNTQSAGLLWLPIGVDHSKSRPHPFSVRETRALAKQYDLCMAGEAVDHLTQRHSTSELAKVFPHIKVFARVSPEQKEFILLTLRHAGHTTLMCGDGTNDVGALKQAHVGVSIVNNQELEEAVERSTSQILAANRVTPDKQNPAVTRLIRMRQELAAQDSDPTLVKLGDASIASPFTARRTSIECVLAVLRQGRCTLVTTLQIFKILALNCLISAYMMSVLYIMGLKQGDSQMTCMGLIVAALFFCLSRAEPLPKLSKQRPPSSVFAIPVVASIIGQFAVHLLCLQVTLQLCAPHIDRDDPSMTPDGEFRPNTINTAVFLITAMMQLNNFVVNYRGHPFMQGLTENKALWYCMQVLYPTVLIATLGWFEPLNDFLQLVPMPSVEFRCVRCCSGFLLDCLPFRTLMLCSMCWWVFILCDDDAQLQAARRPDWQPCRLACGRAQLPIFRSEVTTPVCSVASGHLSAFRLLLFHHVASFCILLRNGVFVIIAALYHCCFIGMLAGSSFRGELADCRFQRMQPSLHLGQLAHHHHALTLQHYPKVIQDGGAQLLLDGLYRRSHHWHRKRQTRNCATAFNCRSRGWSGWLAGRPQSNKAEADILQRHTCCVSFDRRHLAYQPRASRHSHWGRKLLADLEHKLGLCRLAPDGAAVYVLRVQLQEPRVEGDGHGSELARLRRSEHESQRRAFFESAQHKAVHSCKESAIRCVVAALDVHCR